MRIGIRRQTDYHVLRGDVTSAGMMHSRIGFILLATAIILLVGESTAQAWGPATHVKLGSDLLAHAHLLPVALAALLRRNARDYLFGNIAADVVLAKKLSRVKQFCHHWKTGLAVLEDADNESSRAFALGYLSHLAADTVAHNKFLPRQMTVTRSTLSFGHLYWELRADSTIGSHYWATLRDILDQVFAEHEARLNSRLTDTWLPFSVNWKMFYRMNRFVALRSLRRAMETWYNVSRWSLSDQLMREYRQECLKHMLDVVIHQHEADVLHLDPNGNAALAYTRAQRRQLRQMARVGLISPHILYEAALGHAPTSSAPAVPGAHPRENGRTHRVPVLPNGAEDHPVSTG